MQIDLSTKRWRIHDTRGAPTHRVVADRQATLVPQWQLQLLMRDSCERERKRVPRERQGSSTAELGRRDGAPRAWACWLDDSDRMTTKSPTACTGARPAGWANDSHGSSTPGRTDLRS